MNRERECRASISGRCLQIIETGGLCDEGVCEIGDWNDAMDALRRQHGESVLRRASRRPVRGRLDGHPGGSP